MYVRNQFALERQMGVSDVPEAEQEEDFDVDEDGDEDIMTPYELHALASDTEEEYKRSTRHLRREKEPEGGSNKSVEGGKAGSGGGKAAGQAEESEAGPSNAKDGGGARAAASGAADEG